MKKKLLLAISMVALLGCLLAITASATKIGDFEYSLNQTTNEATFGDNRSYTGQVVYIPSTVEYEGVTYTVTAIGENAINNNDNVVTLHIPATVTKLTGGTFCGCDSLTSVYIDTENLTYIGWGGMSYNSSDRDSKLGSNVISYYPTSEYGKENPQRTLDMKLENLTHLSAGSLQGLNVDSLVLGGKLTAIPKQLLRGSKFTTLIIKGEITEIGSWLTPGCSNLTTVVVESRSLKSIGDTAFSGVKTITSITIDLAKVTNIGGSAFRLSGDRHITTPNAQWYNPDGEKIVDLSSLQTIGTQAFAGSNIGSAKIVWPTGMTANSFGSTADSSTFRNAGITGTIYIDAVEGTNLYVDTWCFRDNNYDTVVFGPNVTKVGSLFSGIKSLKTVVFLADSVDVTSNELFKNCSNVNFYFKSLTTNTEFSQANEIHITSGTYSNYGSCGFVANLVTTEGDVTIGEVAHTIIDAIDNSLCPVGKVTVSDCAYCEYVKYTIDGQEVEKKEHSYTVEGDISYTTFVEGGYKSVLCECGAVNETKQEVEAIFICKGISVIEFKPAKGTYSIVQGYEVNRSAYEAYINSGKTLEYGFVAAIAEVTGKQPLKVVNGSVCADLEDKTIVARQGGLGASYLDIKVSGLTADHNGKNLIMSLFAFDGESVYYISKAEETAKQSDTAETIVINVAK